MRGVDAQVAAVVGVAAAEGGGANPLALLAVEGTVGEGAAGQDGHGEGGKDGVHLGGGWEWSGCLKIVVMVVTNALVRRSIQLVV